MGSSTEDVLVKISATTFDVNSETFSLMLYDYEAMDNCCDTIVELPRELALKILKLQASWESIQHTLRKIYNRIHLPHSA